MIFSSYQLSELLSNQPLAPHQYLGVFLDTPSVISSDDIYEEMLNFDEQSEAERKSRKRAAESDLSGETKGVVMWPHVILTISVQRGEWITSSSFQFSQRTQYFWEENDEYNVLAHELGAVIGTATLCDALSTQMQKRTFSDKVATEELIKMLRWTDSTWIQQVWNQIPVGSQTLIAHAPPEKHHKITSIATRLLHSAKAEMGDDMLRGSDGEVFICAVVRAIKQGLAIHEHVKKLRAADRWLQPIFTTIVLFFPRVKSTFHPECCSALASLLQPFLQIFACTALDFEAVCKKIKKGAENFTVRHDGIFRDKTVCKQGQPSLGDYTQYLCKVATIHTVGFQAICKGHTEFAPAMSSPTVISMYLRIIHMPNHYS